MTASFLVKIWFALVTLLVVSLLMSYLPYAGVGTLLIFAIATIKAALVAGYYMGVKREPTYIFYVLIIGLVCLLVLYFALVPDIIWIYGK